MSHEEGQRIKALTRHAQGLAPKEIAAAVGAAPRKVRLWIEADTDRRTAAMEKRIRELEAEAGHLEDMRRDLLETRRALERIRALVDEQANDGGLWFRAMTAPEAYLQMALRQIHAEIERKS